jgi:N-methylhydantoinase A/oxoprolinase/acetone carboxylase beta subunit
MRTPRSRPCAGSWARRPARPSRGPRRGDQDGHHGGHQRAPGAARRQTLFVTTEGFADALLIGDQARPDLFALNIVRPAPLYAGVVEADERLAADGAVVRPLDERALAAKLKAAVAEGYASAAIAFLHSDLNPAHEIAAGELAREAGFAFVALSSEVSPPPPLRAPRRDDGGRRPT